MSLSLHPHQLLLHPHLRIQRQLLLSVKLHQIHTQLVDHLNQQRLRIMSSSQLHHLKIHQLVRQQQLLTWRGVHRNQRQLSLLSLHQSKIKIISLNQLLQNQAQHWVQRLVKQLPLPMWQEERQSQQELSQPNHHQNQTRIIYLNPQLQNQVQHQVQRLVKLLLQHMLQEVLQNPQ